MLELLFDWEDCATCKEVFIYHIFMYFIKRFIYFSILIDKYLEYVFSLTHFFLNDCVKNRKNKKL